MHNGCGYWIVAKLNKNGLTDKQQLFADNYLSDSELNATKAYMAAYPKPSADSARRLGSKLLTNIDIKNYIEAQQEARSERTKIDADRTLKRLAEEVDADLADIFDSNGDLLPIHEMPKIWRQGLIAGIDVIRNGDETIWKIRLSDRTRRLELLGKHINVGAFSDKAEVNINVSMADQILEARKRAGM